MRSAVLTLLAGAATLVATSVAAQTQPTQSTGSADRSNFDRDRNVSVTERPHPEYDPTGLPAGGFRVFPKLAVSVISDDNIYVDPSNTTSDTIFRTEGSLTARSNWSRHRLNAFVRVLGAEYADNSSEDFTNYQVGGDGQIDVKRDFSIALGGDVGRLTEPRTDANAPENALKPVKYDRATFNIQAAKSFNRLRLLGRLDWGSVDYKNGVDSLGAVVFQDGRDREVTSYTARGEYALSPDTALFVEAVFNKREYDLKPPAVALDRDSDGSDISVGANFDLSQLVRGEVQLGYVKQDYAAPLADIDGVSAHARVEWFPTQLVTLRLDASRRIEDATGNTASGYLSTTYSVNADYEFRRNMIVSGRLGAENNDYAGIAREDDIWVAGLGLTYKINRMFFIKGDYEHLDRDSNVNGSDYKINRFGVTLTVQR